MNRKVKTMSMQRKLNRKAEKVNQRDMLNSYITNMMVSQMWLTNFLQKKITLALSIPLKVDTLGKRIPVKMNCSFIKLENTKEHENIVVPEEFEL